MLSKLQNYRDEEQINDCQVLVIREYREESGVTLKGEIHSDEIVLKCRGSYTSLHT